MSRSRSSAASSAAAASAAAAAAAAPSAYESQRQAQIQRNQQLLSSLTGIAASTSLSASAAAAQAEAKAAALAAANEARGRKRKEREERLALMPRRDTPQRRAKGDVNYREEKIVAEPNASAADSTADDAAANPDEPPRPNAALSDFVVPDSAAVGTYSQKSCQGVQTMSLAYMRGYLGQTIPLLYHSPKAAAMSFLVAGWPSDKNAASKRQTPSFNKMSGIQKLANHIALFINVDPEGDYKNQFADGGRRVSWFAQPTQRVNTPVIGQIIAAVRAKQAMLDGSAAKQEEEYAAAVLGEAGHVKEEAAPAPKRAKRVATASPAAAAAASSSAAAAASPSPEPAAAAAAFDPFSVLLFLRFTGGPYLYAGPLAYHSHDTSRTPMAFVFTITEYDTLMRQKDFRAMLGAEGKKAQGEDGRNDAERKVKQEDEAEE